MSIVHVHAAFLPKQKKFRVQIRLGEKGRWVELMTIARLLRYAKADDKPLVIGGLTVTFQDSGDTEKQIREYLRKVATEYMKWKGYK